MKYSFLLIVFWISFLPFTHGQETFPVNDVKDQRPGYFAFTNATIVVDARTTQPDATLIIRDGKIVHVGTDLMLPENCQVIDLNN